jgi:cell division septation protein DedD
MISSATPDQRSSRAFLGAVALFAALSGCGGGRTTPPQTRVTAAEQDSLGHASAVDTTGLALRTDTGGSPAIPEASGATQRTTLPEPVLQSDNLIAGYRIQVLASAWLPEAEKLRDRLRAEGVAAYVEYRSPLYRVRIGDCTDLAEARILRDRAVLMGYDRATIVPTLIQAAGKPEGTR